MFKRPETGYTIFETLIFLAVSGIILSSALILFQGQQSKTQFEQSMRDLDSKIQQYVNDVNSGSFNNPNMYRCSATPGGTPALGSGPAPLGSNGSCLFLGKAISVEPGQGILNAYTVLSARTDASNNPVTSLANANPTVANQQSYDLTDHYSLLWGATILSSSMTYTDPAGNTLSSPSNVNWKMVGFYNSGTQGNNGGAQNVTPIAYNLTQTPNPINVRNLIQGGPGVGTLQTWQLCVLSGGSSKHGLLIVNATGLGVTSKVVIGGC